MNTLRAEQLAKQYKSRQVVKNISLQLSSGEIVGLLGPNGAGKTTSFYMIVGLIQPASGKIFLNHHDVSRFPMHRRARMGIGYLPQEPSIFRKMTVENNIKAILQLRKDITKAQKQVLCEKLLTDFNVVHLRKTLGISLSGGERRRVEIARALAMEPKFMLLDEPFAGIDPISVVDLKRIIRQLAERGIGVLITDHNVRETLDICQRAYIVSDGQIMAEGSPEQILANKDVRKVYLGDEFYI